MFIFISYLVWSILQSVFKEGTISVVQPRLWFREVLKTWPGGLCCEFSVLNKDLKTPGRWRACSIHEEETYIWMNRRTWRNSIDVVFDGFKLDRWSHWALSVTTQTPAWSRTQVRERRSCASNQKLSQIASLCIRTQTNTVFGKSF